MTVTLIGNDTKQAFGFLVFLWLLPSGLKGNETKDNKNGTSPVGRRSVNRTTITNLINAALELSNLTYLI